LGAPCGAHAGGFTCNWVNNVPSQKWKKRHLKSLSLLLWPQAGLHFNTEFLRTRQLETNAARKNDKLLRRQFVSLLILNIVHPLTWIAALCMCSPWGPQWCQFRYPCGELSPLFW
jgi:hypothetical protein